MLQVEHPPPQRRPRSVETWNRLLGVREEPADPVDVRQQMRQALPPRESRDRQYLRDDQRLIFVVEHCTSYRPRLETGLGGFKVKCHRDSLPDLQKPGGALGQDGSQRSVVQP